MGWVGSAAELIGYGGAACLALAYLMNQSGTLPADSWRFPALNLLGSGLVIVSLCVRFNPPSFAIELFWSAISVYGLCRNLRMSRRNPR